MVSKKQAWSMWVIASIFYAYQYILRIIPSVMKQEIMADFSMNDAIFGQFSGVYYIGYSLMHIPIGLLLDRYPTRIVMPGFIILTVLGILPLLFDHGYSLPILGRILTGIGSSAAILGVFKIIRISFSEKYFTRFLSIAVTIGLMGAIYGGAPVKYLTMELGYRKVLEVFVLIGFVLSIISYLIIPKISFNHSKQLPILSSLKQLLSNKQVITICILSGLMVGPLEGFADVWGPPFLQYVNNIQPLLASKLVSFIFVGMCFGAPVLSFIADKVGSNFKVIAISAIIMGLFFISLFMFRINDTLLYFCFIIVGVLCSYQIIAIYTASLYVKEEQSTITTAFANMIIMLFGYFFHSSIGSIINLCQNNTQFTQAENYIWGISVIPVSLMIATIGFTLVEIKWKKLARKIRN